jgi:tryptophan-rich sensory protein
MVNSNLIKFILAVLFTLVFGGLGGIVTSNEITNWYAGLHKPSFNPPNYLFGPVWTLLYFLMGISLYLIWKQLPSPSKTKSIILFFIQFGLNFCWSFIFFKFHKPGFAFAEIILMWIFILLTILSFSKLNKTAAWLLVPYIAWVSFATLLNYSIWQLN